MDDIRDINIPQESWMMMIGQEIPHSSAIISRLRQRGGPAWAALFFAAYNFNGFPLIALLAAIGGFISCCLLYYRELYHFIINNKIVVFYLVVVLLSAVWSAVPVLSLWYACQLCLTVGTAILIGISSTPRQVVRGIFIGMAIVIVASIISGRQGPSAIGPVLVGVTGSKTVIGTAAVALVGSGLAVLFDRQQAPIYRIFAIFLIPLGAYVATHVEAATAKISVAMLPIAFLGFLALRHLSLAGRWAMLGLLLVLVVPLSITLVSSDLSRNADQKILRALNKDVTLTGRTLLWTKADEWIKESPLVGYGYRAFWLSGSSDSLGILHFNRLTDPRVFQLHNTVKEIRVDTGWLGLVAFGCVVMFFLYNVLAFVFLYPTPASAYLAATYLMTLCFAPVANIVGVLFPPTAFLYACGTTAVVFFMNRSAHTDTATATEVANARG